MMVYFLALPACSSLHLQLHQMATGADSQTLNAGNNEYYK